MADVVVNLIDQTRPLSQAGFGLPLILGTTKQAVAASLETNLGIQNAELVFTALQAGSAGNNIQIEYVDPGQADQTLSITVSGTGTEADPYVISISLATDGTGTITTTAADIEQAVEADEQAGALVSVANAAGNDGTGVVAAMAATALSGGQDGIPASAVGQYVECEDLTDVTAAGFDATTEEYKAAAAMFAQEIQPPLVAIYNLQRDEVAPDPTELTDALDTLVETHDDWYWLCFAARSHEDGDLAALGSWVDSHEKLFVCCNDVPDGFDENNPSAVDTLVSSIVAEAAQIASPRVCYFAHTDPTDFPDAALIGRIAPANPGSLTWKFKNLVGVALPTFTTSNINSLHNYDAENNNGVAITYVSKFGLLQTSLGKATNNVYMDITRAKDWLKARITEEVSRLLMVTEKVPYDDLGISQVVAALRYVLNLAASPARRVIALDEAGNPMFSITAPRRAEISATDRANRLLPDVNFTATIAGAVEQVEITGVLQV